jgi:hypothetical protein
MDGVTFARKAIYHLRDNEDGTSTFGCRTWTSRRSGLPDGLYVPRTSALITLPIYALLVIDVATIFAIIALQLKFQLLHTHLGPPSPSPLFGGIFPSVKSMTWSIEYILPFFAYIINLYLRVKLFIQTIHELRE